MDQNIEQDAFQHHFKNERKKIIIIASKGKIEIRRELKQEKEFDLRPYHIEKGQNVEFYQYADGEEVALVKEKGQDYQLQNNQKISFSTQNKLKEVEALLAKLKENQNDSQESESQNYGEKNENTPRLHCVITDYASKIQYFGTITENEMSQQFRTHLEVFEVLEIIKDHIDTAINDQMNGTYVKFDQDNQQFLIHHEAAGYRGKVKLMELIIKLKSCPMENESQNVELEKTVLDSQQKIEKIKGQIVELEKFDQQFFPLIQKMKDQETQIDSLKKSETKVKNIENTISIIQGEIKNQNFRISDLENFKQSAENSVNNLETQINKDDKFQEIDYKIQQLEEKLEDNQNKGIGPQIIQQPYDAGLKQLENKLQTKITLIENKNKDLENKIRNLEQINQQLQFNQAQIEQKNKKFQNQNINIIKIDDLNNLNDQIKCSEQQNEKISRLELIIVDEQRQFEIGIVKNQDFSKMHQIGNSFRFVFPEGTVYRGNEGGNKLISYYPMINDQIGLEVDNEQSLLTVYVNGVKNISMKISQNFNEFSFYVKTEDPHEDVFEFEEQNYLKY